ncbi:hypothetical protein CEXT_270521 [Caerostris extrusa]|uniref:Uncharacterized protein n=1 Tax=Caerostris extrusa TaxID=172846 RepID=A0AAV4XL91_CAEEX|nr:hypothetical protein CEXT_270521 [Caerostris extrusa]
MFQHFFTYFSLSLSPTFSEIIHRSEIRRAPDPRDPGKGFEWSYRCQTRHRLTGEMVTSVSSGKIVVTGNNALPDWI